jgi:hypothetical protein
MTFRIYFTHLFRLRPADPDALRVVAHTTVWFFLTFILRLANEALRDQLFPGCTVPLISDTK